MQRFSLLKPTELAQLAQLSERHEELMQHLEGPPGGVGAAPSRLAPPVAMDSREVQLEVRQLRQEMLKLLHKLMQQIEKLP